MPSRGSSLDPLNHLSTRVSKSTLNDRDKAHLLKVIRGYKREPLTTEQNIVVAFGLWSYMQGIRLQTLMDTQKVDSASYRQASWAYCRHAETFKKLVTASKIVKAPGRSRGPQPKTAGASALWSNESRPADVKESDATEASTQ